MTKKELKAADARIDRAYLARCKGIQIDIMDIGKIFAFGRTVIASGADDAILADKVAAYVATIARA